MIDYQLCLLLCSLADRSFFHQVIGGLDQLTEHRVVNVAMHINALPVALVAIVWVVDGLIALFKFGDSNWVTLEGNGGEVVDVEVAEHVTTDIEHEYREFTSREFLEGGRLGHSRQRQAIITQLLDIHIVCFPQ